LKESLEAVAVAMNRQCRRRIEREWNKIKLGSVCTKFVVRNGLFTIPYVIFFQAVKVGDDLMCVYNVGIFGFKEGFGYLARVTVCQFVNSLFRSLGVVELGFVSEEDLEKGEEIIIDCDAGAGHSFNLYPS
jgi:hypothetical protein